MNTHRLMKILAVITSFGAYCMLLMGAIVSKTGSGTGCGNSWPFCHGQLIPASLPIETVFEYSHRIVSSADGFLILTLTLWSWLTYKQDRQVKLYGFMSLFFVLLQGGLGALTVLFADTLAKEALLALHFGFALISFASVILLTVHLFQMKQGEAVQQQRREQARLVSRGLQYSIWALAAYTYIVVYTGALVRHSHATLGCGMQFPGCDSTYFPNLTTMAGVQMLHRYAAISLWLLVCCLLIVVLRRWKGHRDLVRGSWLAFILITLQAASGIATVVGGGQLITALLHTTIIAIFFSVLCYLCMVVGWPRKKREMEHIQVAAS